MLPLLVALAVAAGAPSAPLSTLEDVREALAAGVPAKEVAARVRSSGVYLPLTPERAVALYFEGVPATVLAAVFATSGSPHPKVVGADGEVELLYEGFRIVGRRGPSGPTLIVSGYARDGTRLAPEVLAPPRVEREPAAREAARYEPPPRPRPEPPPRPAPAEAMAYAPPAPEPRYVLPPWPDTSTRGAPPFVSVTQVPRGSITGGSIVLPIGGYGYPYAYPYAGGFAGCGSGLVGPGYHGAYYPGGYVTYDFGPPAGGKGRHVAVVRDRIRR